MGRVRPQHGLVMVVSRKQIKHVQAKGNRAALRGTHTCLLEQVPTPPTTRAHRLHHSMPSVLHNERIVVFKSIIIPDLVRRLYLLRETYACQCLRCNPARTQGWLLLPHGLHRMDPGRNRGPTPLTCHHCLPTSASNGADILKIGCGRRSPTVVVPVSAESMSTSPGPRLLLIDLEARPLSRALSTPRLHTHALRPAFARPSTINSKLVQSYKWWRLARLPSRHRRKTIRKRKPWMRCLHHTVQALHAYHTPASPARPT